jgi:hypothetical protein
MGCPNFFPPDALVTRNQRKTIRDVLGRQTVHPFPARMAPGIALEFVPGANKPLRVLDPMMGSGTVLAVARSKGHRAVGIDIDPLAVLIAKVWTTSIDRQEAQSRAKQVLDRAKALFVKLKQSEAFPPFADDETKRFITYWFDGYARRQLPAEGTHLPSVTDAAGFEVHKIRRPTPNPDPGNDLAAPQISTIRPGWLSCLSRAQSRGATIGSRRANSRSANNLRPTNSP